MAFSQLHYTSCENGLANYSGFQFCAITPGVPAEVMREVERLTVYELSGWGTPIKDQSADELPINLMYVTSDNLGMAIVARVRSTGRDFSNRPGNYFAHALVTSDPRRDLEPVLAAELWDAPFWNESQVASQNLPALDTTLQRGSITRPLIDAFLAAEPGRRAFLEVLLTATDRALLADGRVLLVSADSATVCRWIAAVSYLLGPRLGPRLTFSTYSHDPGRCLTHVVGTFSAQKILRTSSGQIGFWIFDLDTGDIPEVPACPAAALLARQGAAGSADLWSLAETLGTFPAESLDASFPILASALLMRGSELTPSELGSAIEWLVASRSVLAGKQIERAVVASMAQALDSIQTTQQAQLVELASQVETPAHRETPAHGELTGRVECAIVDGVLHRVDDGHAAASGFLLRTERARQLASSGCRERLLTVDAGRALELLRWAHEVGADPGKEVLRQAGRDVFFAATQEEELSPSLAAAAEVWPALRVGLVDRLASQPVKLQQEFFASSAAPVLHIGDFEGRSALCEEWIISAAHHGWMSRSTALAEVAGLRQLSSGSRSVIDKQLISHIWRNRHWTIAEGSELLSRLPADDLNSETVRLYLATLLYSMPDTADELREWMDYVTRLAPLSQEVLGEYDASLAKELASAIRQIRRAARGREPEMAVMDDLIERYRNGNIHLQSLLDRYLPQFIMRQSDLISAVLNCPSRLFGPFCEYARLFLKDGNLHISKIAQLFIAMYFMRLRGDPYSRYLEELVFLPVLPDWSRSEIAKLGREMNRHSRDSSGYLDLWYRQHSRRKRLPWLGR